MPILNYTAWEIELIETGRIVQDDDKSISPEEAEFRFIRYMNLVDLVEGVEGMVAARALLRSIQAKHDYGAYENTINKLVFLFPPEQVVEAMLTELPRLIQNNERWAGDLLSFITRTQNLAPVLIFEFNEALKLAAPIIQTKIIQFIRAQEAEGWLEDKKGVLGV
jgi:hypothetical protein